MLVLSIIGFLIGLKVNIIIGAIIEIITFILALTKGEGSSKVITMILSVIFGGIFISMLVFSFNITKDMTDNLRDKSIIYYVNDTADAIEIYMAENNISEPFSVTFNKNGNDKNISFKESDMKIISGTITMQKGFKYDISNLVVKTQKATYDCTKLDKLDCKKRNQ